MSIMSIYIWFYYVFTFYVGKKYKNVKRQTP